MSEVTTIIMLMISNSLLAIIDLVLYRRNKCLAEELNKSTQVMAEGALHISTLRNQLTGEQIRSSRYADDYATVLRDYNHFKESNRKLTAENRELRMRCHTAELRAHTLDDTKGFKIGRKVDLS